MAIAQRLLLRGADWSSKEQLQRSVVFPHLGADLSQAHATLQVGVDVAVKLQRHLEHLLLVRGVVVG